MPTWTTREFPGKNFDFHQHFGTSRASHFQKSQFSPGQVRVIFFCARKIKVDVEIPRAKPRGKPGFLAHTFRLDLDSKISIS
jgi:hypothetical protein